MKRITAITFLCLLLVLVFSFVACSPNAKEESVNANAPLSPLGSNNWMREISNDTPLSAISIPGTHDTGAVRSGGIYDLGHNQDLSVAEQLALGVRFLDIRLALLKDELEIYHGILKQNVSFESVVNECFEFLENNPTETILMSVKLETGVDISGKVHEWVQKAPSKWYTQNKVPTLGEVRGKIVLFRRFMDEEEFGVDLDLHFRENTTFNLNNGVKIHVQDYYEYPSLAAVDEKWQAVQDCFGYAENAEPLEFVINFTSGYYKQSGLPVIQDTVNYVQPKVLDYAAAHNQQHFGIVLFDFVNEDLTKAIYTSNFSKDTLSE